MASDPHGDGPSDAVDRSRPAQAGPARERVALLSVGRTVYLVALRYETPAGVERTLTRVYGRARVPGAGETAYWEIDLRDARAGSRWCREAE